MLKEPPPLLLRKRLQRRLLLLKLSVKQRKRLSANRLNGMLLIQLKQLSATLIMLKIQLMPQMRLWLTLKIHSLQ